MANTLKKKSAFTLIEIMAASTIMTILVVIVLNVTSTVIQTWNRSSGQLRNYFDANAVASVIQQDLEGVRMKRDGRAWFEVAYPEDVGFLRGTDYKGSIPMRPPQIMFYSPSVIRPRYTRDNIRTAINHHDNPPLIIPGSLCAVKYSLVLKSPFLKSTGSRSSNEKQINAFFGFYRAVIDSRSTAREALGRTVQGYTADKDSDYCRNALSSNIWSKICTVVDEAGLEKQGQSLKTWAADPENLLVPNMVDFRVTFGVLYPDKSSDQPDAKKLAMIPPGVSFTVGRKIYFDPSSAKAYEFGGAGGTSEIDVSEIEDGTLSFVDVSMTFISEAGAKEMRGLIKNDKLTDEVFRNMVLNYGSTVTRRIHFLEPVTNE